MEDDRSIAELMTAVAGQYRRRIDDPTLSKNTTRLETIRRIELIVQSIKGLMKHEQETL